MLKAKNSFLKSFTQILSNVNIDSNNPKTRLNLFVAKISANEFSYTLMKDNLLDELIDFALSASTKAKLKGRTGQLSKKARTAFVNNGQSGELGELLLYCFLKTHLNAPKILSKMELKTSTSMHYQGSDGVHFLRLNDDSYQLIFGESKTIKELSRGIRDALSSISDFKRELNDSGNSKSGINYEKTLISNYLDREEDDFDAQDRALIQQLIIPQETKLQVDDAFGIFLGYEVEIREEDKKLKNKQFTDTIHDRIKKQILSQFQNIINQVNKHGLQGHCFYIYILPFTDLEKTRKDILEYIIK